MSEETFDKSNTIFECMECGEQWSETPRKHMWCHWCHSDNVLKVCDMVEQMHLLQHEQAQC